MHDVPRDRGWMNANVLHRGKQSRDRCVCHVCGLFYVARTFSRSLLTCDRVCVSVSECLYTFYAQIKPNRNPTRVRVLQSCTWPSCKVYYIVAHLCWLFSKCANACAVCYSSNIHAHAGASVVFLPLTPNAMRCEARECVCVLRGKIIVLVVQLCNRCACIHTTSYAIVYYTTHRSIVYIYFICVYGSPNGGAAVCVCACALGALCEYVWD